MQTVAKAQLRGLPPATGAGILSGAAPRWGAEEPPKKLTRFEAMWTDCDPSEWEYVIV